MVKRLRGFFVSPDRHRIYELLTGGADHLAGFWLYDTESRSTSGIPVFGGRSLVPVETV
jgi:hypothetical protein